MNFTKGVVINVLFIYLFMKLFTVT